MNWAYDRRVGYRLKGWAASRRHERSFSRQRLINLWRSAEVTFDCAKSPAAFIEVIRTIKYVETRILRPEKERERENARIRSNQLNFAIESCWGLLIVVNHFRNCATFVAKVFTCNDSLLWQASIFSISIFCIWKFFCRCRYVFWCISCGNSQAFADKSKVRRTAILVIVL